MKLFWMRYKELILYIFFGGLTTFVSLFVYTLSYTILGWHEQIANVFSWFLAVLFAYITNRIWVFEKNGIGFIKQMLLFYEGRVLTLLLESLILLICVRIFQMDAVLIKWLNQVLILVLNFVISKLLIFKKGK